MPSFRSCEELLAFDRPHILNDHGAPTLYKRVALYYLALGLILAAATLVLVLNTGPVDGAPGRVDVSIVTGPGVSALPGETVHLLYDVNNTGDEADRYRFSISTEHDWTTAVEDVTLAGSGEAVPFDTTDSGVFTMGNLAAGDSLLVLVRVEIPYIPSDQGEMYELGLDEGSSSTIALMAAAMSDNYVSRSSDDYRVIVEGLNDVVVELTPSFAVVKTIGEENDRRADYHINLVHVSNRGGSADVRLFVFTGNENDWTAHLEGEYVQEDFNHLPAFAPRCLLLSVTAAVGVTASAVE